MDKLLLRVKRSPTKDGATIGELSVNDVPHCCTLEPPVREVVGQPVESWKVSGHTAIPCGTYRVISTFSPKFGQNMPLIVDVPGFDAVRIHCGNDAADTEACILVGTAAGDNTISASRAAFNALWPLIDNAILDGEDVFITVE